MQGEQYITCSTRKLRLALCSDCVEVVCTSSICKHKTGEHRHWTMDRSEDDYYFPEFQQRQTISRPGVFSYWKNLDGEHLLLCLVSAIAVYAVGYIIAWLFFSGIMFFLSVGLVVFLVMEIADSVDSSVGEAK